MTPLDHALAVAAAGLPVFPCNAEKRPLVETGFKAATLDPRQIRTWWRQFPAALIGVPTGAASRLFAVDLDGVAHGGPCGLVAWDKLTSSHAAPPTRMHETPNGGAHLLFRYDPQRPVGNRTGNLPAGIDIRGSGGYVIWPPSRLPDGRAWRVPENCETNEIADAPDWLYELIAEKPAAKGGTHSHFWRSQDYDWPCTPTGVEQRDDRDGRVYAFVVTPDGTEHVVPKDELFPAHRGGDGGDAGNGAYAEAALANELAAVAGARRGARNETLNKAAFSLGQLVAAGAGALSCPKVEQRLFGAAHACGLVADDGESGVKATIKSGLDAGMRQPRAIPEPRRAANGDSPRYSEADPQPSNRGVPPDRAPPHGEPEPPRQQTRRRAGGSRRTGCPTKSSPASTATAGSANRCS
jgi:hypothetical protein